MVKYEMTEEFASLKDFDTPTVTNAVATYPMNKDCLALYNPWKGKWYSDQTLKCMYPELGRRFGYVVTAVYGPVDPSFPSRYTLYDILKAIEDSPKPVVLAIKQNFPEDMKGINGLAGGMMCSSFKALGCEAVISDGPSRDLNEIRDFDIQYMLTGTTAGHGTFQIDAINVPVDICGMEVAPGDIVHMDENGAVKFPADKLHEVVENCKSILSAEADKQQRILASTTAEEVWGIFTGSAYGKK